MDTIHDLVKHIERIAWDDGVSDTRRLEQIQGMLYQWGCMQDNLSDITYGDDDAHINSPNMRRC